MSSDDERGENFDGKERRRAERVPAKVGVRFRGTEEVARAIKAYSVNFSTGGLCLRTEKTYEIGHPLQVTMEVAGEEFTLQGAVAWARKGNIGVRFVNLSEENHARLVQMVAKLKA